jgi:DNA-binding LytR/AlgR family response regulator
MLLAWPIVRLIERYLLDAATPKLALGHLVLALGFSLLWYIGLQIGYGLQNGIPEGGIVGRALSGPALSWQLFQGVTLYAVIALFGYATHYKAQLDLLKAEAVTGGAVTAEPATRQIFLKDGRTIRPTALEDVLLLSGAGDYTEVATKDGTYLSSTSLNAFEAELPSANFLRVHRSHIVRTDAVLSVESGGNGRLILHLPKGVSVTTSRAGAKAVRDLAL